MKIFNCKFRKFIKYFSSTVLVLGSSMAFSSEHREAAGVYLEPSADITDFYAYVNPFDKSKLVLAAAYNGFASTTAPETYSFSNEVRYDFNIDNDGDVRADHLIRVTFSKPTYGPQEMKIFIFPNDIKLTGSTTFTPTSSLSAPDAVINEGPEGIKFFAGLRDDPFFFDVVASFRAFSRLGTFSTGIDRFKGLNVSAIVIELPLSLITNRHRDHLQIWADSEKKIDGHWKQIQRVGNPAVKPIFIPNDLKDKFNATQPWQDAALFTQSVKDSVINKLGGDDAVVKLVLSQIVPDTIKIDINKPAVWPNGRAIDEDTMDLMFAYNLNKPFVYAPGDLDGVHYNDVPFLTEFPYLAPPHIAP
jgi:hypothetical protein